MATDLRIPLLQAVLYIGLFSLLVCGETSESHECDRKCEYPPKPRLCEYEFTFQWYYSMPMYCWDCPTNPEDCTNENCIPLDGSSRPIVVTNEKYPGPNIQVCQGDTIRVKVNNSMEDELSASIHWHGQYQYGKNWMDGVDMVTQCPIKNGPFFVYEFLADPAGTHLWYDMSGFSQSDGLFGALIVRKPIEEEAFSNAYDYDLAEHVIVMSDWSSLDGLETFTSAYAPAKVTRDHTTNILINGKAQGVEYTDEFGSIKYTPREMFNVVDGYRYRMRIVSAATTSCNVAVYIDSHSLTVIAADGGQVDPLEVNYLIISPGESYDFVIHANQEASSYCMNFVSTSPSACHISSSALLQYNGLDDDILPCLNSLSFDDVVSSHHGNYYTTPSEEMQTFTLDMLYPLDSVDSSLVDVDDKRYILLSTYYDERFYDCDTYGGVQMIDNVAYKVTNAPLMSHESSGIEICEPNDNYEMYQSCSKQLCSCSNVMKLELGKVIEFVLVNVKGSAYPHPMHMHGHSFHVMGQGTFDELSITEDQVKALDQSGKLQRLPLEHAVIKNTVDVPLNGYVIIRWKADNAGFWYLHSEVVNHRIAGMSMVIQVGDDDEITKPPIDFPKCGPWSP